VLDVAALGRAVEELDGYLHPDGPVVRPRREGEGATLGSVHVSLRVWFQVLEEEMLPDCNGRPAGSGATAAGLLPEDSEPATGKME